MSAIRMEVRLIAVETVEIAHSVRQIGSIQRQTIPGDEIFGIVVKTEDTMMFGGIGRLEIQGVDVFRILAAVTIIIDIGQHTTLKTIVGIVSDRRQDTEVPTRFNLTSQ